MRTGPHSPVSASDEPCESIASLQFGADVDPGAQRLVNRAAIRDCEEPGTLVFAERTVQCDLAIDDREPGRLRLAIRTILNVDAGVAKAYADTLTSWVKVLNRS